MARSKEMEIAIKIAGKVESSFKNALGQATKGLGGITKAVGAATAAAAAAVGGIGIAAINTGREFEGAMSQVAATMLIDKTSEEGQKAFETLENAARDCGASTAFSATEAAEALNYLALAGYDADKAATALPTVLKLAGAGAMELAAASDMVTDSMSALGIEATEENLTSFADKMAQTASKSNTSVAQLGEAILTVGGTAQGLAGGTTELNAALGILADNGIKAAEGGTHLRNMILSLQSPRNDAAAALFEDMGLKAYDAEGNMRSLGDVFGDLNRAMAGASAEEVNNTLSTIFKLTDLASARAMLSATADSVQSLGAVMDASLAESGTSLAALGINLQEMADNFDIMTTQEEFSAEMLEQFGMAGEQSAALYSGLQSVLKGTGNRFEELSAVIEDSAGACENMYAIQLDNLNGDIDILKSGLSDLGISIYKDLNGPLRKMTGLATDMVKQLSEAYKEGGMSGMVNAVGDCLSEVINVIAGQAPKMVSMGVDLLKNFIGGITANSGALAASAAEVLPVFISGLFSLVPQIILAGMDIITQFAQSITAQLPQIVNSGTQAIINFVNGITQNLPILITTALTLIQTLINSILSNAPQLLEAAMQLISSFAKGIVQALPEIARMGIQLINSLTEGIKNNLPKMIPAAMEALVSFSSSLREHAGNLVDAGLKMIMTLAQSLIDNIPVFIQTIPTIITNICGIINDNAPKLLVAGMKLVVKLAAGIIQAIPTLIANIPKIIQAAVSIFTAFNWFSLGGKIITFIKNGIHSFAAAIPQAFKSICTKARTAIHSINWKQLGSQIIGFIVNGIKSLVTAIPSALKNIGTTAINWVKNIDWLDLGISIIKGIIGGFVSMGAKLWDVIKALFTGGDLSEFEVAGIDAAESYVKGVSGGIATTALNCVDTIGAAAAGTQTGEAFSAGMAESISAGGFNTEAFNANMSNMGSDGAAAFNAGLDTGLASDVVDTSNILDEAVFAEDMTAMGAEGAEALSSGLDTELAGLSINTEVMSVDTSGFTATMTAVGADGAKAISAGINQNSQMVTQTAAILGTDINATLDSVWEKTNLNAQTAMQRLASTVTNAAHIAANAIKAAFENITITIPRPKIPIMNVLTRSVPHGEGGNINVPDFSVSWNAKGGIFDKPTLFNTSAGLQGVGEAGPEAILPLDTLWTKMKDILNETISSSGRSSIVDMLLERLKGIGTGAGQESMPKIAAANGPNITYAPVYHLLGSATKQDVVEAEKLSQSEFNKMLKQFFKDNGRVKF